MGVTPASLAPPTTVTSANTTATGAAGAGPTYKMEPTDPGLYYPGAPGVGEGDPHAAAAAPFQPSHSAATIPGVSVPGPDLGSPDFMQTLQTYMGQPVDMQHHEGTTI